MFIILYFISQLHLAFSALFVFPNPSWNAFKNVLEFPHVDRDINVNGA